MNELFPSSEAKCDSALSMLPDLMDKNLGSEQRVWLEGHLKTCPNALKPLPT